MAVTDILKIEIWQLRTIGSQKSIPSVPIALGTYYGGYMGCLGAYEQPNVRIAGIRGVYGAWFSTSVAMIYTYQWYGTVRAARLAGACVCVAACAVAIFVKL